jgi:ubiquinone/menaquinone biosynthesis C-methylase UbiE
MKRLAQSYEENPAYFDCLRFDRKYMFPFVAKAYEEIARKMPFHSKILDICGGPGNLGLGLALIGFEDYVLADIDEIRMRWGALLWRRFGRQLRWQKENALQMSFNDESFDVVTLLGWESASLPYSYTLKECVRVLRKGGTLVFTYHDVDGIVEGRWDFDPRRSQSYLPYSISWTALRRLCEDEGLKIEKKTEAGHAPVITDFFPDVRERTFPQYVVFCKKSL